MFDPPSGRNNCVPLKKKKKKNIARIAGHEGNRRTRLKKFRQEPRDSRFRTARVNELDELIHRRSKQRE